MVTQAWAARIWLGTLALKRAFNAQCCMEFGQTLDAIENLTPHSLQREAGARQVAASIRFG